MPCPGWAEHLGAVTSAECYVNPDDLGDTNEVICVFSYAGEEPHALVTVVDYNTDGMIKDGWVTSRVGKLLDHCREASSQRGAEGSEARHAFRQVDAGQARHMLETALTVTDAASDPPVSESVPVLPRVHPGPDPGAAAVPRALAVGHRGAAARLEQGPPGHARRRVPRLRRGRGPVRPRFGQPLRRTGSSTTGATRTSGGRCG